MGYAVGFIVWCIMIVIGFIFFYFLRTSTQGVQGDSSAQDILDKRYANGKMNRQVYEDKSNALKRIA